MVDDFKKFIIMRDKLHNACDKLGWEWHGEGGYGPLSLSNCFVDIKSVIGIEPGKDGKIGGFAISEYPNGEPMLEKIQDVEDISFREDDKFGTGESIELHGSHGEKIGLNVNRWGASVSHTRVLG